MDAISVHAASCFFKFPMICSYRKGGAEPEINLMQRLRIRRRSGASGKFFIRHDEGNMADA